jgi:hypothetical protein
VAHCPKSANRRQWRRRSLPIAGFAWPYHRHRLAQWRPAGYQDSWYGQHWAAALLAKHLVIGCMVAVLAYQTWYIHPHLERFALGLERPDDEAVARLRRLDLRLLRVSVVLSAIVLVLTAVARANA